VPWLIAEGLPRDAATAMLRHNPARFFSL